MSDAQNAHDLLAGDTARNDMLILVDEHDQQVGTATKEQTHTDGLLHRAFSVTLLRNGDDGPELLLVRRAACKYHSGGLWTNSCCSHPRNGENLANAVVRRVNEELGVSIDDPVEIGSFLYRAEFENGLVEHEFDHVFVARCEETPSPDPAEADEVRWVHAGELAAELQTQPEQFTAWAPEVFRRTFAWLDA